MPTFDGPRGGCTRFDWIFGRNRFRQCVRKVMNIKTTALTSDHRLLLVNYLLWWPSSKKRMAPEIDWSCIALPSTRTDLVTSTRQFQEKLLTSLQLCLPLPRSHCLNQLPQLVFDREITTLNSGNLGVRFRERIINLANTVHNIQQP